jgi:hypothetical protein
MEDDEKMRMTRPAVCVSVLGVSVLGRNALCRSGAIAVLLAGLCLGGVAVAEDPAPIAVILKDHRFAPSEIHVPVGKRMVLVVHNEDTTPEEFDSSALQIEKVITGGTYATIRLHPLGPGRYPFMGEFHPDSAQGVVISE